MMFYKKFAQSDFFLDLRSFGSGGKEDAARAGQFLAEVGRVMVRIMMQMDRNFTL